MTIIYCDGGCYGNGTTNAQTYGSFSVNGQVHRVPVNGNTNNQAEYLTLIEALKYCRDNQIRQPEIRTDSQLVVNQVTARWSVKQQELRPLCDRARQLWFLLDATLVWVPRDQIVSVLGH